MGEGALPLGIDTTRAAQVLAAFLWAAPVQSTTVYGGVVEHPISQPRAGLPSSWTSSSKVTSAITSGTSGSMSLFDDAIRTYIRYPRPTTIAESAIGEMRGWSLLEKNWDGEEAESPVMPSLKSAVAFVRALRPDQPVPTPMLHANGLAGLFWESSGLYADLEFLENSSVAYYIERDGGKHKGVVPFDSKQMPDLFSVLIRA